MIKFFRKIRKQLLTQNKVSKYLLYAIGEIVLVVIGILIALQVNNLNEQHQIRKTASIYKEKLINDMVSDTIQLNTIMSQVLRMQQGIEAYFQYFENGGADLNILLDRACNVPTNFFGYFPINYTFRDMQESGNITLLTEEERKALMELSNSQEFMAIILENSMEDIKMHIHERNKIMDFDLSDSDFYTKISWEQAIDSRRRGLLYQHNVLTGFDQMVRSFNYRAKRIKKLTTNCLILLNKNKQ